jgi:hypothetical protein
MDAFFANPRFQRPRRSVYVADLEEIERISPILARALSGHVVREDFGASRLPDARPSNTFADYHVEAIRTSVRSRSCPLVISSSIRPSRTWSRTA